MSIPAPGKYVITNRALSPTRQKLAITFGSANNVVTVTPANGSDSQQWTIAAYNATTMTIAPFAAPSLQIGWGGSGPTPMTPGNYTWTLLKGSAGFTIQDGGKTVNWYISEAQANNVVTIGGDKGTETYRWDFEPVTAKPRE